MLLQQNLLTNLHNAVNFLEAEGNRELKGRKRQVKAQNKDNQIFGPIFLKFLEGDQELTDAYS